MGGEAESMEEGPVLPQQFMSSDPSDLIDLAAIGPLNVITDLSQKVPHARSHIVPSPILKWSNRSGTGPARFVD